MDQRISAAFTHCPQRDRGAEWTSDYQRGYYMTMPLERLDYVI